MEEAELVDLANRAESSSSFAALSSSSSSASKCSKLSLEAFGFTFHQHLPLLLLSLPTPLQFLLRHSPFLPLQFLLRQAPFLSLQFLLRPAPVFPPIRILKISSASCLRLNLWILYLFLDGPTQMCGRCTWLPSPSLSCSTTQRRILTNVRFAACCAHPKFGKNGIKGRRMYSLIYETTIRRIVA